jgi:hypothetical protein
MRRKLTWKVKTSQDFLSAQQPISQGDAAGGRESRNLALVARKFTFNGWWPKTTVKKLVAHTRSIGGPGISLRNLRHVPLCVLLSQQMDNRPLLCSD